MSIDFSEKVTITLGKAAALVLSDILDRSYKEWEKRPDHGLEFPFVVQCRDNAERKAIWQVEGELEKTLVEVFAKDYSELVAKAKIKLVSD